MKRHFSFFAFALMGLIATSHSAQACPEINGNFMCVIRGAGQHAVQITTKIDPTTQSAVYELSGGQFVINGQSHQASPLPAMFEKLFTALTYSGKCEGNAIQISGEGMIKNQDYPSPVLSQIRRFDNGMIDISISFRKGKTNLTYTAQCR